MTIIFYGVSGEGNGHAIRAEVIIRELKKQNTVHMFSHGKGYHYLKQKYPVNRILGFHMYYVNNTVSSFLTGIINTLKFPLMALASLRYVSEFIKKKPDFVISDFEPFVCYWAIFFGVPCISSDNQHSITHTKIDKIPNQWLSEMYSRIVITTFLPNPEQIFITTFFPTEVIKSNTLLFPPILRKEIIDAKSQNKGSQNKGHIFVYQTSTSYKKMFGVLKLKLGMTLITPLTISKP